MTIIVPTFVTTPKNRFEAAENIAHILVANGVSVFGELKGKMTACEQRRAFGVFLGKGEITINGETNSVSASTSTLWGNGSEAVTWVSLEGLCGFDSARAGNSVESRAREVAVWSSWNVEQNVLGVEIFH
jgi:hypothetical protein